MGMFDHIRCEYPLPKFHELQEEVFQTKSFECLLDEYTITKDGRLILHAKRWEVVPEEERPYYGKPEWKKPLYRLFGSLRTVSIGDVEISYHGDVFFYTVANDKLVTFRARFTNGRLESLDLWDVESLELQDQESCTSDTPE